MEEQGEPFFNKSRLREFIRPKHLPHITAEQEKAFRIAQRYFNAIQDNSLTNRFTDEARFLLKQQRIINEIRPGLTNIESRTLYSEIAALYYLFVGRGLDDLYSL